MVATAQFHTSIDKDMKPNKHSTPKALPRQEGVRSKKIHYLIVCEGTETEPNYFENFIKGDRLSRVVGAGRVTLSLVEYVSTLNNLESFDRIWVVFDEDDDKNFNKAIEKCHNLGFEAGWTNEAFELWLYLHFEQLNNAIKRAAYIDKLETFIRKHKGFEKFKYDKNNKSLYAIVRDLGDEETAIKRAKNLRKIVLTNNYKLSKPCTTIDILVEELRNPETLLKKLDNLKEGEKLLETKFF